MAMAATALLVFLFVAPAAYAAQHTVGDTAGWTTSVSYTVWAAGKTFTVGDTLLFSYGITHQVDVVSKDDHDNCATGNALETHSGGNTVITLDKAGPIYFLCPTSNHCSQGMKLAVTVTASPSGSPPTTPSPTTPSPPSTSTPTSPTPTTPPPPSTTTTPSGASSNFYSMNFMVLGASLVLAPVLALVA